LLVVKLIAWRYQDIRIIRMRRINQPRKKFAQPVSLESDLGETPQLA
jgi:hypothetical protein